MQDSRIDEILSVTRNTSSRISSLEAAVSRMEKRLNDMSPDTSRSVLFPHDEVLIRQEVDQYLLSPHGGHTFKKDAVHRAVVSLIPW